MTILRHLSKKSSIFFKYHPSTSNFYFRSNSSSATSADTSLVDDLSENRKLSLKKRSFTKKEQESNFGRLVYKTPIYQNVYWCKTLSLSTSMLTVGFSPYFLSRMIEETNSYLLPVAYTLFGSIFVFTPLLLNQLTKRMVLEMYFDSKSNLYTAVYFNVLVFKRALRFRLDDVRPAKTSASFLYTHVVGENLLLLARQGYLEEETRSIFESMIDQIDDDENEKGDDDDNDEPAKATTDHHKRQQDQ